MRRRIRDLADAEGVVCSDCMREAAMDYLGAACDDITVRVPRADEQRVRALLARPCPREDEDDEQ